MIKEPTASVFIVRQDGERGWLAALIWHPRLQCWLPAGGHVECDEAAAEAAVREVLEESGLDVTLMPGPAVPLPAGFPHRPVPAPWWVTEVPAAPDRHTGEPHIHVDHVFVATADSSHPARKPEHRVRWFTAADLAGAPGISEDSRLLAAELLAFAAQQRDHQLRWASWPDRGTMAARHAERTTNADFSSRTGSHSNSTRLIVIRGNSASGKSAAAAEIRSRVGRGLAISQDNLRRVVLRERDIPGGANVELIDLTARLAMSRGFHVVIEGILRADHYGAMLTSLVSDYTGRAFAYYLDVPFEETLRRHATKPQDVKYGEAEMREWYRERDLLPGSIEHVIPAESSLENTVNKVTADVGLDNST